MKEDLELIMSLDRQRSEEEVLQGLRFLERKN
jgi:hypothetical protein